MDSVITCRDLRKDYGRKRVLTGVDLEVPAGSVFALLGTNGAGKTTLIRIILGLLPKSGGEIRVLGEEPYRFGPDLRQRIGYVSEEQGLYPWMTVKQTLDFVSTFYTDWDQEKALDLLSFMNLNPQTPVGKLSKGMRARLKLILTLGRDPALILLDEPLSGIDPPSRERILEAIIS
ncbi:MAG: ABC transporter ATP-binding protein, partial [Firmicutes bacterium]|nr:ABC transporter ATP-binding protein [Bacillota bacterium]